MKGNWVDLAKGQYSKFFVLSVVKHAKTAELRGLIIPDFFGSVNSLLKHKVRQRSHCLDASRLALI
jgi:hypothetical protein